MGPSFTKRQGRKTSKLVAQVEVERKGKIVLVQRHYDKKGNVILLNVKPSRMNQRKLRKRARQTPQLLNKRK